MVEVIRYLNSFKIRTPERREDVIGKTLVADAGDEYREAADYSLCFAIYL